MHVFSSARPAAISVCAKYIFIAVTNEEFTDDNVNLFVCVCVWINVALRSGRWLLQITQFNVFFSIKQYDFIHILKCILLILLLKHAQFLLDPMQQVGALEAAALPVTTQHDGAEAAHQHRGPIQVKLLWHHLVTRCPIAAPQAEQWSEIEATTSDAILISVLTLCPCENKVHNLMSQFSAVYFLN